MTEFDLEKYRDDDVLDAALRDAIWNDFPAEAEVSMEEIERMLDERMPELLEQRRIYQRRRIVRIAATVAGVAAAIAVGVYLLLSANSTPSDEQQQPSSAAHSLSHPNPQPAPQSAAPEMSTAPSDLVAPPVAATPTTAADGSKTRVQSRAFPDDNPVSRVLDLPGNDFIDLTQAQAEKLGITFGANGEIRFGYSYLFKSRPPIPDSLLEAMPFKDALTYGLQDSGLVMSLIGNTLRVTSRPTSEFRAGPIATSWRYLTDGRGAKITQRYDADTGNWRYSEGGVDYTWQRDRPVDETKLDERRWEAMLRTYRHLDNTEADVELNTWLPLRVARPYAPPGMTRHVVFWCAPTQELLAALPAEILPLIRSELIVVVNPDGPSLDDIGKFQNWGFSMIPKLGALGLETTAPIIDTKKMQLDKHLFGGLWQTLDPLRIGSRGPVLYNQEMQWQGRSLEDRTLTARLLYFEGTPIASLLKNYKINKEHRYITMKLPPALPSGIYQIDLTTNKGERATYRIFLERGN